MRVYVETNYVLELSLEQEQACSCREILEIAKAKTIEIVIPSFSLTEPYSTLVRHQIARRELHTSLAKEFKRLVQTSRYAGRQSEIFDTLDVLITSAQVESTALTSCIEALLGATTVIPLEADVVERSYARNRDSDLSVPDSVVLESVLSHLRGHGGVQSCFLNKNIKDFDEKSIKSELAEFQCKLITSFDAGLSYINASTKKNQPD